MCARLLDNSIYKFIVYTAVPDLSRRSGTFHNNYVPYVNQWSEKI